VRGKIETAVDVFSTPFRTVRLDEVILRIKVARFMGHSVAGKQLESSILESWHFKDYYCSAYIVIQI